jgi:hypothetical protein
VAKRLKPKSKVTELRHGGRTLAVPTLSGPVGPESPALKAKYSRMNAPADVELVDYYLSAIEAVKGLGPSRSNNPMGLSRLFGVVEKNIQWSDRNAAIQALQRHLPEISDLEEKEFGIVKPDVFGSGVGTWRAIVDLGDTAERLLGDAEKPGLLKYLHTGIFDRAKFRDAYREEFKQAPPQAIFDLLTMMEQDAYVIDVRWMAYMLGTCYVETARRFVPLDEFGKGDKGWRVSKQTGKKVHQGFRRYYLPAKVRVLPDGRARVTEQDGDQFMIESLSGRMRISRVGTSRGMGVDVEALEGVISETYAKDDGEELKYYGRGYVQITWWSNYAEAGAILNRKFDFLLNPELVKDPRTAYTIMSVGMRTGTIFANGMTLARFISGSHCDYFHARQMVNALSGAREIAEFAEKFERVLLDSKHTLFA